VLPNGRSRLWRLVTAPDAVVRLAEQDPAAARRELRVVLDGDVPVLSYLTRVEAHLLDALACRDLGDERASQEAAEQALNLAEPDRLILPSR
jgi:LuxR family maltose regulon positive regulatory protein